MANVVLDDIDQLMNEVEGDMASGIYLNVYGYVDKALLNCSRILRQLHHRDRNIWEEIIAGLLSLKNIIGSHRNDYSQYQPSRIRSKIAIVQCVCAPLPGGGGSQCQTLTKQAPFQLKQ